MWSGCGEMRERERKEEIWKRRERIEKESGGR
jgi:hypothetical protein